MYVCGTRFISGLYRGMYEIATKAGWSVDVTNMEVSDIMTPEDFMLSWKMNKWFFTGSDLETNTDLVENHTVSLFGHIFGDHFGMTLQPMHNVIQVSFDGITYPQNEVFESTFMLQAASCLKLRTSFLEQIQVRNAGATGGLRIILFTGSTNFGREACCHNNPPHFLPHFSRIPPAFLPHFPPHFPRIFSRIYSRIFHRISPAFLPHPSDLG